MRIEDHIRHTQTLYGESGKEIHEWIDAFFDHRIYRFYMRSHFNVIFNPYGHRKHRHCREVLPQAINEFCHKYPEDIIIKVFLQHLKDDYRGYIPCKSDFDDSEFLGKYHKRG